MVRAIAALTWYSKQLSDAIFLIHAGLVFLVGWLISRIIPSVEFPTLVVVSIVFSVVVYYIIKRSARRYCTALITQFARDFKETPTFRSKTSEKLVDAADIDILSTLRQSQDVEGDCLNLIARISNWFPTEELLRRIGKLNVLGYLRADRGPITITPEGLDLLARPPVAFQAQVPVEVAARIASMKLALNAGNLNEVVDGANRLFERILRRALETRFPSGYESEWGKLVTDGKVKAPYERASLGELKAAAEALGIVKPGSIYDNLLLAYLKIRVPQKHEVGEITSPESSALTTMNLVESYVRLWYQPSHAEAA